MKDKRKNADSTSLHCTPPSNAPTPCTQDYHQPQTPYHAIQLCPFPRLTAVKQKE